MDEVEICNQDEHRLSNTNEDNAPEDQFIPGNYTGAWCYNIGNFYTRDNNGAIIINPITDHEMTTEFNEMMFHPENEHLYVDFEYSDSDSYTEEIAEFYTYSEVQEFDKALRAYEQILKEWNLENSWQCMKPEQRQSIILRLLDLFDVSEYTSIAKNSLLYIAQGCWKEVRCLKDQQEWTTYNVSLLVKNGVVQAAKELLAFEVEKEIENSDSKKCKTMIDSVHLRITLNLIYTIVETVRVTPSLFSFITCLKCDISEPIGRSHQSFIVLLFEMVNLFGYQCHSFAHFPIKKIVLLLWKCLLVILGGEEKLKELKGQRRESCRLQPEPAGSNNCGMNSGCSSRKDLNQGDNGKVNVTSSSALKSSSTTFYQKHQNKITQQGVVKFVKKIKEKYIEGFDSTSPLICSESSLSMLPTFVKESVSVLQKYVYVSLGEVQLNWEDRIFNCPMSFKDEFSTVEEIENLYTAILPGFCDYAMGFSRILALVAPKSCTRNIFEVIPDLPIRDSIDKLVRDMDATRHKEIIFKAVSAIILLLLKHFKVNHILQFEQLAHILARYRIISGFAAFFQVDSLIGDLKKNYNIESYNFPNCVLGNLPELTMETIRSIEHIRGCWRTIFAYINTSRILNKFTKGKPPRIVHLISFQIFPKLNEALKLKEPMFQHYAIKLIKMQAKYVWKNRSSKLLKMLTDVYGKVRTNLTDEWINSKDHDYQGQKLWNYVDSGYIEKLDPTLQQYVQRFHWRKYGYGSDPEEDVQTDYSMLANSDICDEDYGQEKLFKDNYEKWLEQEVFTNPIDWDAFLQSYNSVMI